MNIIEITQYSEEALEALNELLPQLLLSALPLSADDFIEIIQSKSSHLFMAEKNGLYHGSLTLITAKSLTGIKVWIEDVVVNENIRSKEVGSLLIEHAVWLAKKIGAQTIELTSRPSRTAANALYKKIGFEIRNTNGYQYKIT